jgi:tripartite-type tricarboxylate transporter receptor subunit TctC
LETLGAGGGAEQVARIIAEGLQDAYGQTVVLDFRPGANGTVGTYRVSQSAPDGLTLMVTSQAPVVNMRYRTEPLPYDPDKDLTPIALVAEAPFIIAASAKFGPSNMEELVTYAKENPGKINAGISGFGGSGHLGMSVLSYTTGIEMTMVPYAGTGERLADLMAGRLDLTMGIGASGYLPGIQAGTLKPIAIMGQDRLAELPEVTTTIEQGFPDTVITGWYLISGPGALPDEITSSINTAITDYLKREDIKEQMLAAGNVAATSTVEEIKAKIQKGTGAGFFNMPQ